jgi:hypothetical protein
MIIPIIEILILDITELSLSMEWNNPPFAGTCPPVPKPQRRRKPCPV